VRRPSVAALVALGFTPEQALTWRAWVEANPHRPKAALALAAEMLPDGQGVAYLRQQGEYGAQVYLVDRADAYASTLLWTRGTQTFRVGCWGSIAEKHPNAKWGVVDVAAPKETL
jgi:hypothetical protein